MASPEIAALEQGLRAVRESAENSDRRSQETLEAVHETLEQIVGKLAELETSAAGHQLAVNLAQQHQPEPRTATNRAVAGAATGGFRPGAHHPRAAVLSPANV